MRSDIASLLDKHKAFWKMEELDRPLMNFIGFTPMELPLADGRMAEEDIHLTPELLSPEYIHSPKQYFPHTYAWPHSIFHTDVGGPARQVDAFLPIQPYFKVPWMEAIIGCKIRVGLSANTMWSEPIWSEDWYKKDCKVEIKEEWLNKLKEFVKFCVDNYFPSYLISHTLMRGPIDMFEALVGIKNLCLSVYKAPEKSVELLSELAEVTIKVMEEQLKIIPPFHGGYSNQYGIWSPGKYVYLQTDASHAISPKFYEEYLSPIHNKVSEKFEYSVLHLHSGPLYEKGPSFARIVAREKAKSIEVSIDPPPHSGPPVTELLPLLKIIHEEKPLIIMGHFTFDELKKIVNTLPSGGLYIGSYYRPIVLREVSERPTKPG